MPRLGLVGIDMHVRRGCHRILAPSLGSWELEPGPEEDHGDWPFGSAAGGEAEQLGLELAVI